MLLEGVQAWMWVPLAVKGRVIGGVGVAHAERNAFTAHHADLALTVANQAAIAMVNAELYEQAQTLAVLHERQRLAQELHDAVNQSLFSAGLIAEVLPRLWEQNREEGRRALSELRRLTHGALAEMRMLLAELRPAALTDTELGDLLRLLGSALAGRTNIPVVVTVAGEGALPGETQVAFYRVCQEALNNVARHAGASRVDIDLHYAAGTVELRIRDDGCGFDPEHTPAGHYGLSMMVERAGAVGAVLSVTSQPGHGAEIAMRWTETGEAEGLMTVTPAQPIRVMLVDDHMMVRRGLATILKVFDDLELAGEAGQRRCGHPALCARSCPTSCSWIWSCRAWTGRRRRVRSTSGFRWSR